MITIHAANAADFSGLGLGALTPASCEIEEQAGGLFELRMVHPMDAAGKWENIAEYRVIKAPAPVRETPLIETNGGGAVYSVNVNSYLRLRTEPSTSTGKVIGRYKNGTRVVKIGESGAWYEVVIEDGGATGWMHSDYLTFVEDTGSASGTVQPRQTREQLFRICEVEIDDTERMVSAVALHITYDLSGNIINGDYDPDNAEASAVCAQLKSMALNPQDFHIYCTAEGRVSGSYGRRNIISALLDTKDGVLVQSRGCLVRDNMDLFVLADEKRDRGVEIRHGKNLTGAIMTVDVSKTVNRIVPVGKKKNGDPLYLDGDGYVDSPRAGDMPVIRAEAVKYNVQVVSSSQADAESGKYSSESAARVALRELAEADFLKNEADLPILGLEVDFVALEHTTEYAKYAGLQALHLYDIVHVISPVSNIRAALRMTGYVWDALARGGEGRYNAVTLGKVQSISDLINGGGGISQSELQALTNRVANAEKAVETIDIPEKLPNPHALTFSGGAAGTYDGSTALSVEIPQAYTHPSYTAHIGVPAADQTPGFGGSFSVSQPVSDGSGHVKAINSRKITIPDTAASASTAGLMSAADKAALDNLPAKIAAKADAEHGHEIADVAGLQSALAGKADVHEYIGALTGNPTANQTPSFGSTFTVSQVKTDDAGHVTSLTGRTVKIPNSAATTSAAGLMSAADKEALDNLPAKIAAKADAKHGHEIEEVTGLQSALAGKADVHEYIGALTGNPTANATPGFGSAFTVSQVATNDAGHVTSLTNRTVKIPNATATASAAGLMSAADKTVLDGLPDKIAGKADTEHGHEIADVTGLQNALDGKETKGAATSALSSAKAYTDTAIATLIGSADSTMDTLGEIQTAMEDNAEVVAVLDAAIGTKANAADLTAHTGNTSNPHKVNLSQLGVTATAAELNHVDGVTSGIQAQLDGKAAKTHGHEIADVAGLQSALAGKADVHEYIGALTGNPTANATPGFGSTFTVSQVKTDDAGHVTSLTNRTVKIPNATATTSAAGLMSAADKTVLDGLPDKIAGKADAGHTHSAYVNQNAFSNVKVGDVTITADSATDTVELVAGSNVTLTPDAANGKVTVAATDTVYTHPAYTARTGVPTANQTPGFGGTFSVSQPVSDATGHITAVNSRTVTIPNTAATTSAAGLMSAADKTKLDGIATGATKVTVDSSLSGTSTNPVQNKAVHTALAGKSDTSHTHSAATTSAAGLMSAADKSKLDGVEANANFYAEEYVGALTGNPTANQTPGFGSTFTVSQIATNDLGKVTSMTDRTVKIPNTAATTSAAGLMSAADKSKLDGIATGATKVTVDASLSSTSTNPVQNKVVHTALAGKSDSGHTHSAATTSAAGLMNADDKAKLDGIAAGANKITVDTSLSSTSTNPVQNKVVYTALAGKSDTSHSHSAATTSAAGLMSASDKTKLDGIATGANKITVDTSLSSTSTNPVQNKVVQSALAGKSDTSHTHSGYVNQNAFSNVKVGETTLTASSATDTVELTAGSNITLTPDADGRKVAIAAKDTVYTHPGYTARTGVPTANQTPGFGGTFSVSQPVSDATGHITAVNSRTITIPSTAATTSAAGLMSAADKSKLDGIEANANKYIHEYNGALTGKPAANQTPGFGGTFTVSQVATNDGGHVTSMTDRTVTIPSTAATTAAAGLMSAADKSKLDGIATGANKITVDTALSSTSTNPVQNKVVHTALAGKSDTSHTHSAYLAASSFTNANLGQGYGTCATAAATAAKVVTLSGYTLTAGGVVTVKFTYAVPANATMNINGKGAKNIFYRGAAIKAGLIESGDAATFIYDGTQYHLLTVDRHRFFSLLVPYGIAIGADVDLNTTEYMKVGNYYCAANATAKTLVNCPTTSAFMMTVASPLSTSIDNETTGTWVYRLRKLQVYTGEEFVQYCYAGGTAGTWTYGAWLKSIKSNNTATTSAAGLMSSEDKTKLNGIAAGANNYVHEYNGALTGNPTANQTPGFGSTFTVSQVATNDAGHVTSLTNRTVKIPNATATSSAAGLMSAADKQALDGVPTKIAAKADAENGVYYIEGSGSATSVWKGSHSAITAYYAGLAVLYKNDATGESDVETTLNINNLGAVTVKRNASTTITTHYPIGSVILLTYTVDSGTAYFKTADYDANNYAYVRQYYTTSANNYPLLTKYDAGTSTTTSYVTKYSRYSNKFYVNPSTGVLTAPKFAGALTGNADTATKLAEARTIAMTGAVAGSGSFDGSGNVSIALGGTAATNLDTIISSGVHFGFYTTTTSTTGTPYAAGLTGWGAALVLSYGSSANNAVQIAFSAGTNKIFVRQRASGTTGSWSAIN